MILWIYIYKNKEACKRWTILLLTSLCGTFMLFDSDLIHFGIIWIMFCVGLAYYSSRGYYLDLILQRIYRVEVLDEDWIDILSAGKSNYGKVMKVISFDRKELLLNYCYKVEDAMEKKKSTIVKPNEKYKTVYYYLKKSKVIVDVDFIPTGEFIEEQKGKKRGRKNNIYKDLKP